MEGIGPGEGSIIVTLVTTVPALSLLRVGNAVVGREEWISEVKGW